ncbi:MAG: nucleotidyl transferase AbiEii/AbiGii toxin family protein [Rhodospirillaceae bacterium]|nr:nucleotidyl transferase AbiEii/AbiGii toxin family protein [Rhodospirillaceae bacterium]
MNSAFDQVIAADDETRLGLYTTTAQRLGTTPQNVEKDFWVCWTLDALFNGLAVRPRLLFKGGTSLSKGFDLIKRFSEDIDVTVFRDDLGEAASIDELEALSGNKRGKALAAIKAACEAYINGPFMAGLSTIVGDAAERNGLSAERFRIEPDSEDRQALHLRYPTATPEDAYVGKAVKIESGAKSALDPNSERVIRPYLESDIPGIDLSVQSSSCAHGKTP